MKFHRPNQRKEKRIGGPLTFSPEIENNYCFAPPSAPRRHDLQIPKPVPLAWMKLQSWVKP